jgi:hypothetical protein
MANPTSCQLATTAIDVNSHDDPTFVTRTDGYTPTGCTEPPMPAYGPSISVDPENTRAGAPNGAKLTIETCPLDPLCFETDPITSHTRSTSFAFPDKLGLSTSAAGQLDSCTPAQVTANSCPANSKLGDVKVWSPFVDGDRSSPATLEPLTGAAYFGVSSPGSRFPAVIKVTGPGVTAVVETNVDPSASGQISASTTDQPQVPFTKFELDLRNGDHAPLVNPRECGTYQVNATFTPWSGQAPQPASDSFDIDSECPNPRPFGPQLATSASNPAAGQTTHLTSTFTRPEQDQLLTGLRFQLPPGLIGSLAAIPRCPADAGLAGTCGPESKIADLAIDVGAGNSPLRQSGQMYLTQPLRDGDVVGFSLVVPAKAGPIDLGTVVTTSGVRLTSRGDSVDIETTSIPTLFEGVPIFVRRVDVASNRDGFIYNPTNCDPKEFRADFESDKGATAVATSPFQASGCDKLGFNPRLTFSAGAKGQTKRDSHPPFKAHLTQGPGEAAIRSARTVVPNLVKPDVPIIQRVLCQAASAAQCPQSKAIGQASVETPLLPEPVGGLVYLLQEPGTILPKIAIAFTGVVSVDVNSRNTIENIGGGLRVVNYFDEVPDVPVSRFRLSFFGGRNGILLAAEDLCEEQSFGESSFTGHNGKKASYKIKLAIEGCPRVARMAIKGRTVRVSRRGIARMKMRCPKVRACDGEIELAAKALAKTSAKGTLGSGRVKVRRGKLGTVKVKLNRKTLRKLRKRRKLRVNAITRLKSQPALNAGRLVLVRGRR